jgi:hypothetical protein
MTLNRDQTKSVREIHCNNLQGIISGISIPATVNERTVRNMVIPGIPIWIF